MAAEGPEMSEPDSRLQAAADRGDPEALCRLGVDALHRQQFGAAERWLRQGADAGSAAARNALAAMYLYGMGVTADVRRAVELYEAASEAGHADACFTLANLYFVGAAVARDDDRAGRLLRKAAVGGSPGALRVLGFIHARRPNDDGGGQKLATACFTAAAAAGDPLAMHIAGMRCLHGSGTDADAGRARYWFEQAAAAGVALSVRRLASLSEVTAEPPSPESQADALDDAADFQWPAQVLEPLQPISRAPRIGFVDNVLTGEECDYLIMLAEPSLMASLTLDPISGKMVSSTLRTSRSMNFQPVTKDIALHLVERRLATLAEMPVDHAEPLAVLHYRKGEEYKPHYDYFTPEAMAKEPRLSASGQRLVTTFVYLTDVERGGGTDFPRLMKTVEPRRGRALLMHNCDPDRRPYPATLHAGLPVVAGEKWLVTLWFRERPFVQG